MTREELVKEICEKEEERSMQTILYTGIVGRLKSHCRDRTYLHELDMPRHKKLLERLNNTLKHIEKLNNEISDLYDRKSKVEEESYGSDD